MVALNRNSYMWSIIAYSFFIVLLFGQGWVGWYRQYEFRNWNANHSSSLYRYNSFILTWLAEQKYLRTGQKKESLELYQQAIQANPTYMPAWLGLADIYYDQGNINQANILLDFIQTKTTPIVDWHWKTMLLAYQLNREDILSRELPLLTVNATPTLKQDIFRLALSLWPDIDVVSKKMNGQLPNLLMYATKTNKLDLALALWPKTNKNLSPHERIAFIDFLIQSKQLVLAKQIWKETNEQNFLFVYDGTFNEKPMQRAFGWRTPVTKGAELSLEQNNNRDENKNSIRIRFTGENNIDYAHFYQILPLDPGGSYQLSAEWKSNALTTDQLPFLEVAGYSCSTETVKTDMIDGDTLTWQPISLTFSVPDKCEAMIIRLRRLPSVQIDNLLKGNIWLRGFSIIKTNK